MRKSMNRRNFLKSIGRICAVLPFVGSSSAVAKTGASKEKLRTWQATEIDGIMGSKPKSLSALEQIRLALRATEGQGHRIKFISITPWAMNQLPWAMNQLLLEVKKPIVRDGCGRIKNIYIEGYELLVQANTLGDFMLDCGNVIMAFTIS